MTYLDLNLLSDYLAEASEYMDEMETLLFILAREMIVHLTEGLESRNLRI